MRLLSKTLSILLPFCFFMEYEGQENTDYILLKYAGKTDKPISITVFYLNSFEPKERALYDIYKVNSADFTAIKMAISSAEFVNRIDTSDFGYYNYLIYEKTEVLKFTTQTKYNTQKMLGLILKSINDSTVKAGVQKTFEDTSIRIW